MKALPWIALGYVVAGVGVAAWTASRGQHGKPHAKFSSNAPIGVLATVALWPAAVAMNLKATKG